MAKILLLDDETEFIEEQDELLSGLGFRCICTTRIDQARWAWFETPDINLLITDLHLPDGNAIDLLREIRDSERGRHLPIIVISGKASPEEILACRQLGVPDFLAKPIACQRLLTRLRQLFPDCDC